MKCKYCEKIFSDDSDLVLIYFDHIEINHLDALDTEDKMMHEIRKKMLQSKNDYELKRKRMVTLI